MAFGIFVSHGLCCYVAIDITWNEYVKTKLGVDTKKIYWELTTRTVLVLATCMYKLAQPLHTANVFISILFWLFAVMLAVAIPNLELFISLFGALCLSALGLAFPALIEYCTFSKQTRGFAKVIMVTKCVLIALIGAAGLVIGTYTSLEEIIKTLFHGKSENH